MNSLIPPVEAEKLLGCLAEWNALTRQESLAIERDDWTSLERAQTSKQALQRILDELLAPMGRVGSAGRWGSPEIKSKVLSLLEQLKAGERENASALDRKLSQKRQGIENLNQATRNLRQIHRAYGSGPSAGWQSYS